MRGFKNFINEGMFDFFKNKGNRQSPYAKDPSWSGIYEQIVKYYGGDEAKADVAIQSAITNHGAAMAPISMFRLINATGPKPQEDEGSRASYDYDQYLGGGKWKEQ